MTYSTSLLEALIHRTALLARPVILLGIAAGAFVVSPVLSLLVLGYLGWSLADRKPTSGNSHGTARWASVWDLIKSSCIFQNTGLPLGSAAELSPATPWQRWKCLLTLPLSRSREAVAVAGNKTGTANCPLIRVPGHVPHMAYFGASGSGKSTCLAVPALMHHAGSLVCLDPKGELTRIAGKFRQQHFGQAVYVIDPFGVAGDTGLQAARVNPLALYLGNDRGILDKARRFADSLVVRTGQETDQFWPNASVTVLTAVLAFLMSHARPEEATLNNMRNILSSPKLMDEMLSIMLQSDKCCGLLPRAAGQLQQLAGQTKASVMSVANSHIDFLDSPAIAETLLESSFDPRDLVQKHITVFLCLPVERLATLQGLQRILISTLINVVFEAGEDPHRRIQFVLDESATLGPMESLYSATQFGRSFGLRMTYLFQSISQVDKCFPESRKDDVMATVGRAFLGTNDFQTAENISKMMGDATIWTRNDQSGTNAGKTVSHGIVDQNPSRNTGTSSSTSFNEAGRPLLRPEEILQLPQQLGIVLLPGIPPILIRKLPYWARQTRRLLTRGWRTLTDLFVIAIAAVIIALAAWLWWVGPAHPLIMDFRDEFLR